MSTKTYTSIKTPIGGLAVVRGPGGVEAILFVNQGDEPPEDAAEVASDPAADQLAEYFRGERQAFELELNPQGTPFQRSVWEALLTIPYGETTSYSAIAEQLGNPKAVRAVGAANGKNPLAIVVPCHRVIGKGGSLTGYAGGLNRKAYLLDLERGQPRLC